MRRYSLPLLSGVLMTLAFYPFYFWPLALVALAPLYYFVLSDTRSAREVFWGGALAGLLPGLVVYYCTVAQLVPGLGPPLYTWAVRATAIPGVLSYTALFGLMALAWRFVRGRSPLISALGVAACYLVVEHIFFLMWGGYYPDALAAALVPMPAALAAAAVGGIPLVSFLAALFSASLAAGVHAWRSKNFRILGGLVAAPAVCAVVFALYQAPPGPPHGTLAVSIIQQAPVALPDLMFGTSSQATGAFSDPPLQWRLEQAAQGSALVIYPFSPVEGIVGTSQDAALGRWLSQVVAASTSVLLWNTVSQNGQLFDELALWRAGRESVYQKHLLYAFSDYSPAWARSLGVTKADYTITAATATQPLMVDGTAVAGLICSELHQDAYARAQSARADLIIAAGYDAFFPGDLMGNYSLAIARYRAAESGEPVVRANFFGPSAVISAGGKVEALLPYGGRGILRGSVLLQKRATPYAATGPAPVYLLAAMSLALGFWYRTKSPYSAGRR